MTDFTALNRRPIGTPKRSPPLPGYDYPAVVKSFEDGASSQKKTPYTRFHVAITGWPETLPESSRVDSEGVELDYGKKSFRYDFYRTPDAEVILFEFLQSCGVETEGATWEEAIPQCIGAQVVARVQQTMNENTNEVYNPPWLAGLKGTAQV